MSHTEPPLSTRELAGTQPAQPEHERAEQIAPVPPEAPADMQPVQPGQAEQVAAPAPPDMQPVQPDAGPPPAAAAPSEPPADTPLVPSDQGAELKGRWEGIQGTFVDSPRDAVENADALVAQVMQLIAEGFARERESLEDQWGRGDDVSTEDLRVALQRYRSFFQRLLSA